MMKDEAGDDEKVIAVPVDKLHPFYTGVKSYQDLPVDLLLGTAFATLVSGVTGYLVISWLLKYLVRGSFMPFVIWRVAVGSLLLIGLSLGAI